MKKGKGSAFYKVYKKGEQMLKKCKRMVSNMNQKILLRIFKVVVLVQGLFVSFPSYALSTTKIVTGTSELLDDAGKAALLIEAVFIVVLEIVTLMKCQATEESQVKAKYMKRVVEIIIIGGIILTVTGVVPILLGYYL